MNVTMSSIMRRSFVLTDTPSQYGVFCKRMKSAGFSSIPLEYPVATPRCLIGDEVSHSHAKDVADATYRIVSMANALEWDCVTVFEHNAYPMTDCNSRLIEFFDKNPIPDDAVAVSLGNTRWIKNTGQYIRAAAGRYKLPQELYGSHAIVYLRGGYDLWLSGFRALEAGEHCRVDAYERIHPKCYATDQSFFIQVTGEPVLDGPRTPGQFADFSGLDPNTGIVVPV